MLSTDLQAFAAAVVELDDAVEAYAEVFGDGADPWLESRRLLARRDVTACIARLRRDLRRRRSKAELHQPTEPVRDPTAALWMAVIGRALQDARGEGLYGEHQAQAEARAWLLGGGADLHLVAHLAGLDPAAVIEACERLLRFEESLTAA